MWWHRPGSGGFAKYPSCERRVLAQLLRAVEWHITAIRRMKDVILRYKTYSHRFTVAMDLVDLGDVSYLTDPLADSTKHLVGVSQRILSVVGKPGDTVESSYSF